MVVSVRYEGPVAIVTIDNPPVNAASAAVRQGLTDAVAEVEASEAGAAVLVCAGRTFVAGADVREFGKPPVKPDLPEVVLTLEGAAKPWVAAIHGTVLGGGLELALGCSYRIAAPGARLGLPEVNLGIIPGAGGTVRLPRIVGAERALDIMASGKPISAKAAFEAKLVDAVVEGDLTEEAIAFATLKADQPRPEAVMARPVPPHDPAALERQIQTITAKARGQNSPVAVCDAVRNTIALSAEEALAAERALFLQLKDDPQSLALRHIFFAERAAGKTVLKATAPGEVAHVGVVGGGTMGAGIATACLLSGLSVTMIERDEAALEAGQRRVGETLAGSVSRGLVTDEARDEMLSRFAGATDYAALSSVDLVIEAVFEDMAVKQAVFAELDRATRPDAILATNTSYLDVGEIAASVANPSRVIGLHFFSPAHIMKLLEIVAPDGAAPGAVATGAAFGKHLGKITVPAGVCDGFIGNRVMSAYRREADYLIEDGALPAEVDAAMRAFGFPMGIFEMADLAGLDIGWAMRKRRAATRDPAERYVTIADTLCEMGRFGRKTGAGWYRYEDGKTAQVDPVVTRIVEAASDANGIIRRTFSEAEIMERILSVMQAEGRALLSDGIADSADDVDVVMVHGYGFPRWRGGPMFMAR